MLKVVIIDGHGMIFRTINAAASEIKKESKKGMFGAGLETDEQQDDIFSLWKRIFMSSMFNILTTYNPDKVILAIDDKPSWRKLLFSGYKAKRKSARDKSTIDFEKFYPILDEFLDDFKSTFENIYVIKCKHCEGDDIMAVTSRIHKNDDVVIISSDGDINQLLSKNIKQFDPRKRTWVKCINPQVFLESKILQGDDSDNIPGIFPGIGPKTVLKYLNVPLDELLTTEKIKENYLRNRLLITLTELPEEIESRISECYAKYQLNYSPQKLRGFMNKHKLNVVMKDVQKISPILRKLS